MPEPVLDPMYPFGPVGMFVPQNRMDIKRFTVEIKVGRGEEIVHHGLNYVDARPLVNVWVANMIYISAMTDEPLEVLIVAGQDRIHVKSEEEC